MSFVSQYVTPLLDWYTRWLDGKYVSEQLQFKGSSDVGGDYVQKIFRAQQHELRLRYQSSVDSVIHPTYSAFIDANLMRLLLNPIERLITAFQAYPTLKARFHQPGTFSHTFTEILNEGVIFGAYKGFIYNFLQFSGVLFPAVYLTNKVGDHKLHNFIWNYTIFDTLLYPLDTLKNILYSETLGKTNLIKLTRTIPFFNLYRGIFLKLTYNVPALSGIYASTQTGCENQAYLSWLIAGLIYPLNTLKIRHQLSITEFSTWTDKTGSIKHGAYRGVVPYLLLNMLAGWALTPLLSKSKLDQIYHQCQHDVKQAGLNP